MRNVIISMKPRHSNKGTVPLFDFFTRLIFMPCISCLAPARSLAKSAGGYFLLLLSTAVISNSALLKETEEPSPCLRFPCLRLFAPTPKKIKGRNVRVPLLLPLLLLTPAPILTRRTVNSRPSFLCGCSFPRPIVAALTANHSSSGQVSDFVAHMHRIIW